jgi:hypothetical protein
MRGRSVAAGPTQKLGLILAVGLIALPARRTDSGGVARVHEVDLRPGKNRFVLDERTELMVRLRAVSGALRLSNRCPSAKVPQVLQGDSLISVRLEGRSFPESFFR